jgi:hypothetical protein
MKMTVLWFVATCSVVEIYFKIFESRFQVFKILGSNDGEDVDYGFLGCIDVKSCRCLLKFRRGVPTPFSEFILLRRQTVKVGITFL